MFVLHGTLGSVSIISSGGNTSGMPPTFVLTTFNLEINYEFYHKISFILKTFENHTHMKQPQQ